MKSSFTTETQRHREEFSHAKGAVCVQYRIMKLIPGIDIAARAIRGITFQPLPFSVSLCLCGENVVCQEHPRP